MSPPPASRDADLGVPNDALLLRLALVATLVAGLSALAAWLLPDFYARDPVAIQPQMYGQDLVTMGAVVVMLACLGLMRRGSLAARLVVLGGLLYLSYTYTTYAFGARFNALFLPYVAVLGSATYALLVGLASFPTKRLGEARVMRRALISFFLAIPILFGALWLLDIFGAYASGGIPAGASEAQMPTSPIHVQDLAFILPLSAATAVLLWKRSAWAPVFAGIMLVKAVTICLAMLAMGLMAWRWGEPVNLPVAGAALATLLVALGLSVPFFRGLRPGAARAARPVRAMPGGGFL